MFKKRAYLCVINDLVSDARIQRQAKCLEELGWEVLLIGRRKKNSLPLPSGFYPYIRMNIFPEKGVWFYLFFQVCLFYRLLFLPRSRLLISNDTDTLLPVCLISRLKKVPFFYDSHELFWEVPELERAPLKREIWKRIEKLCIPYASECFTVNDSIAKILQSRYLKEFKVVRNIPARTSLPPILPEVESMRKKMKELADTRKILLYQGSGMNIRRGLEEMLEAMQYLPDEFVLILLGGGDVWSLLKKQCQDKQLGHKVIFFEKIPRLQLEYITPLAHAGLSLDKPDNPNYLNSLPNKIFDYIQSGIPVIVSAVPEVVRLVQKYSIGIILSGFDPRTIASEIEKFMKSPTYEQCRQNITLAQKELDWEKEKMTWIKCFEKYG